MNQMDSELDCSMAISEVSLECEWMEQTYVCCANSRPDESIQQRAVPMSYLYSIGIPHKNSLERHVVILLCPCTCVPLSVSCP